MAHEVETMFSAREIPWHGLGTISDEELTIDAAIVAAGLDWKVEPVTLSQHTERDGFVPVVGWRGYARSTDGKILNVAREGWTPIQNRETFEFVEALLDEDERIRFTSAGSLRGGRIVWATVRLGADVRVNGDEIVPFLTIVNAHDGTMAFRAMASPIRVVCMNTLTAATGAARAMWNVRHTASATKRVAEAKASLGLAYRYLEDFETEVDRLMNRDVEDAEFRGILDRIFPALPVAASKREQENRDRRVATVTRVYEESPTIGEYRGTGWGVVNSVNEWELWSTRQENPGIRTLSGFRARQLARIVGADFPATRKAVEALAVVDD